MRMKKFLTYLLTLAMVVSLLPATAFAANNTATTMRLAKTQGTVSVTNATGKKVTQTANMKLYNGYKLKTGAKSYAWISLDDTKAAKLDANSVVSVQKTGQKLTLYLSSGNIFFNVKEKLSGGESFHIKTSTMTTGIRGTSGCVRVINPRVTEIHLLTGQINVYTENPELHISKTAVLTAGQKATSLIAEEAMAATGEQADIIIEQLTSHEVCGNCSVEIAADPELVERIKEEAPHLLPDKIADEAADRLAADEKAADEKQAAIEEAVNNQTLPEDVDPYFEKEESSGGGGGGGGGGSSTPVTDPFVVSSWSELVEAVRLFNNGTESKTITVADEITQDTDDTITVADNGYTLTIDLTTAGITMNSTIENNGNLVVTNTAGHIITTAATVVNNTGTFTLKNATLETQIADNGVVVENSGTFNMTGGTIKVTSQNGMGVSNTGTANLTGGTISVTKIATGAVGVESSYILVMGEAITVEAYEGTAVKANNNVTLGEGAEILAYDTAQAVVLGGGDEPVAVTRPIKATISAARFIDNVYQNIITPFDEYMSVTDKKQDNMYTLVDNWDAIDTWAEFVAAIEEFNSPETTTAQTILLSGDIVDATEDDVTDFLPIGNASGTTLTIDLNGHTLALPTTLKTGSGSALTIAGGDGGKIIKDTDWDTEFLVGTVYLIENNTTLTLNNVNISSEGIEARDAAMSGLVNNNTNGILNLESGQIDAVSGSSLCGIMNSGTVNMNGGTINAENGQAAIENYGTAYLNDGTINVSGMDTYGNNSVGVFGSGGTAYLRGCDITVTEDAIGVDSYAIMEAHPDTNDVSTITVNIGIGVNCMYSVFTMNDGIIDVKEGVGVSVSSENVAAAYLNGGTIMASVSGTTAATVGAPQSKVTVGTSIVIKAKDKDDVYTPAGYTVTTTPDAEGYYHMVSDGINTWAEFMAAVADYNESETDMTITLTGDIDPSDVEVQNVTQLSISNTKGAELTLDLDFYRLGLPATLEVTESSVVITADSGGDVEGTITTGQEWDASGSVNLISNTADLELASGSIIVPTGVIGVYNEGTFEMSDGYVAASGGTGIENANNATISGGRIQVSDGIGVYSANMVTTMTGGTIDVQSGTGVMAYNPFAMEGGQILVSGGTGVSAIGATSLTKGEITAGYDAVAVANSGTVSMGEDMTVRATVADNVMTLTGSATLPDGYVVSTATDGEGYFCLTPSTATVPMDVSSWEEFVNAVTAFNAGTSAETITLMADIEPTAEMAAADPLPAIGNGTSTDLTINLGGHMLGLPTTLATNSSSGLVIDGTGTIAAGPGWNNSAYLINNYTELTLKGGTITVPHNVVGVNNTGVFEMTGGNMEIWYSTGIQNSKDVVLSGGSITLKEDNETYSDGGTYAIGYQAYAGINSASTLKVNGTDITIEQGILYYFNDGNGDVYSPPAGIYNEAGTVTYTVGDMYVGTGVGISNSDTLIMNGGIITVNEAATAVEDTATGIESFSGTFTMNLGTIDTIRGTGLRVGGTAALNEGTITATTLATAVESYSANVTMGEQMMIRGSEADQVYVLGTGGALPAGYEVSDTPGDGGYYHLEALYSVAAEEFVQAVNEWDGTDKTITLTESITVDYDVLYALGYDALEVPVGTGTLTIDLDTYTLTLGTQLLTYGNTVLTGSGEVRINTPGEEAGIIVNGGTTKLQSGSISGSANIPLVWVNDGGTLIANGADIMPGISGAGITVNDGGIVTVNGGTISAQGEATRGVEVNGGKLNVEDGAYIYAGDLDALGDAFNVVAIYDHGGKINITGGEIIAEADETRAYALYSDYEVDDVPTWNDLTVDIENTIVKAATAANVITPSHVDYGTVNNGDGYYKLTTPN